MKFISYAQNFEDVILWRVLKHIDVGFYIDVGAAWPTEHSVTKAFYDAGWRGINVEPNPEFYTQYALERPRDINLQLALSDSSGEEIMNFINDTGLSSMDSRITETHHKYGYHTTQQKVKVTTLNEIFREYIENDQDIHFLKIDVEGLEAQVIKGCDWTKNRPWIIVVEATVPMSQELNHYSWESDLLNANYKYVYMDGLNRFYVSDEHEELTSSFTMPPNVFDSFITHSELKKENNIKELKEKNSSLKDELIRLRCTEKTQDKIIEKQSHDIWALHHNINMIYQSKFWRYGAPLRIFIRYSGKLYRFIKFYDNKESPKALIRFMLIEVDRIPKVKSLIKKIINKTPLRNVLAKVVYDSIRPPIINQASTLSRNAEVIRKKLELKFSNSDKLDKE